MKPILFLLSVMATQALSELQPSCGKPRDSCCCMSYKPECIMNTERMFHVKLFYNRKKGISPEEFNQYWAYKHAALAEQFHLRIGVYKYSQVWNQLH